MRRVDASEPLPPLHVKAVVGSVVMATCGVVAMVLLGVSLLILLVLPANLAIATLPFVFRSVERKRQHNNVS
ncbi:MAG: hypothetical protein ACR2H3_00100 [Acidimicrobiales bacterium]